MIIANQEEQPVAIKDPGELFAAHLEVMTHLMRDDLRWSEQGTAHAGFPVFSLLRRERRQLLEFQRAELEREARFRLARNRKPPLLEGRLGLASGDALAVAWHFDAHMRSQDFREDGGTDRFPNVNRLLSEVGMSHSRLLNGDGEFVPRRIPEPSRGLAMSVAIAATRLARARGGDPTWIEVEPVAREILQSLMSEADRPERQGAAGATARHSEPVPSQAGRAAS